MTLFSKDKILAHLKKLNFYNFVFNKVLQIYNNLFYPLRNLSRIARNYLNL